MSQKIQTFPLERKTLPQFKSQNYAFFTNIPSFFIVKLSIILSFTLVQETGTKDQQKNEQLSGYKLVDAVV